MKTRYSRLTIVLALATAISCAKDPAVAKREHLETGNRYLAQQRYTEAIGAYRLAVRVDPLFADARVKLAEAYEKTGDSANALREYVRAADLLPNDAELQVKASSYLLAAGALEDAAARAQKAIDVNPRHVIARLHLALALAGLKGIDNGIKEVEESIRMDPSEPKAFAQLGNFRLAQRNLPQAEQAFKSAHAVAPQSIDGFLGLSTFYMSTGRMSDAELWLKRAIEIAPKDARANRSLAALYIRSNRAAEAEAPLRTYAEATPDAGAQLVLADYYFAVGRTDDARKLLDAIKDREQTFAEARLRLSIMEFMKKNLPESHRLLDEVLTRDPQNARVLAMKGRYLLHEGKSAEAVGKLEAAVGVNPKLAESQYWLGVAYRSVGENEKARARFMEVQSLDTNEVGSKLQLAQMALLDRKADAALDLANQAISQQPGNVQAHLIRADALVAKNELESALSEAILSSKAAPGWPQPHMQMGRIYMRQKDYASAERAFAKAAELSGNAHDAVGAMIDARIAMGKLTEARTALDSALSTSPKNPWLRIYQSRILRASRDDAGAERALQEALSLDSGNLQAYLELTRMYVDSGRLNDAQRQLEAIVSKDPQKVWAHTMVAISFELQQRTAEARDRYRKVLEIDSRAAIAANNLAMIYVNEGQNLSEALQLAQTAVQQLPDSPEANDTLGYVYLKQNLPALAVRPFNVSASKEPGNPLYHYHLGLAYARIGEKEKARSALERALALGKDFEGSVEAKRVLASL